MSRRHRSPGNRTKAPELLWRVRQLILEQQCSPRQISGYLREKEGFGISHEAIYKMVRADENGTLAVACRHWMKYRRHPSHSQQTKATNIRGHVSIHERPEEADGTRFGDRVMDLIVDARQNTILTLTERSTHFLLMTRLEKGKKASQMARQAYRLLMPYKGEMMHAITTDNSSEFDQHQWIARRLG